MKNVAISAACAAVILLLGAPAGAQVRDADVTGGRVAGAVANGIASFKGIPFAAPPVGALRWKTPQPVKAWTGVKQATSFGASCMQDAAFAKLFGARRRHERGLPVPQRVDAGKNAPEQRCR